LFFVWFAGHFQDFLHNLHSAGVIFFGFMINALGELLAHAGQTARRANLLHNKIQAHLPLVPLSQGNDCLLELVAKECSCSNIAVMGRTLLNIVSLLHQDLL